MELFEDFSRNFTKILYDIGKKTLPGLPPAIHPEIIPAVSSRISLATSSISPRNSKFLLSAILFNILFPVNQFHRNIAPQICQICSTRNFSENLYIKIFQYFHFCDFFMQFYEISEIIRNTSSDSFKRSFGVKPSEFLKVS